MYLSPAVEGLLPMSGASFMRKAGVVEMVVGLAILRRWTRFGSYIAAGWLVAIAANLVTTGIFFDLAVRDVKPESVDGMQTARSPQNTAHGNLPLLRD
jgi:hypothetical protein